jgi:hypothetical protein
MSEPADTEFAAMFVPSWARVKAAAMKKTPARLGEPPSSRNEVRRSRGFQIGSPPKMITEEEDTIIPIKEVVAKPMGMVKNWDQSASLGLPAKRLKSASLTTRKYERYAKLIMSRRRDLLKVAKLLKLVMIPLIIAHAKGLPVRTAG